MATIFYDQHSTVIQYGLNKRISQTVVVVVVVIVVVVVVVVVVVAELYS